MSTKTKIIIIICAVLLIAVIAYFIFRKPKSDTDISLQPIPGPTGTGSASTGTSVFNDSFPLMVGSKGNNVKRLQIALNRIKPLNKIAEDGVYGNSTKVKLVTSVATMYYGPSGSVSEGQLNQLIQLGNNA